MIQIFNFKITDRVKKQIEEGRGKPLGDMTKEQLCNLLGDFLMDSRNEYIWTEDDIHNICSLEFGDGRFNSGCWNCFYEVKELGIYIAQDCRCNELHYYGNIGDTSDFVDYYLTYYTGNKQYVMKAIKEICWYDEENLCKKAVDDLIKEYEDQNGEDKIEFYGDKRTSIEQEIDRYLGKKNYYVDIENMTDECISFAEKEDYVIGYYLGEKIYKIRDKLYYLTDDSYSYNTEYCWTLQEVGRKCYDYFDM